jgi:hypothetical protein
MPRGGARIGAGRKKLAPDDPLTLWIVDRLRRFLLAPCMQKKRSRRWLRQNGRSSKQIDILTGDAEISELTELREAIRDVPLDQRAAMINNPEDTPLADIRAVLEKDLRGLRFHRIPEPTAQDLGEAYEVVARLARLRRQIDLTPRQIERRVAALKKSM